MKYKALMIILVSLLCCHSCLIRISGQTVKRSDVVKSDIRLTISLLNRTQRRCLPERISLAVELVNISKKTMVIDTLAVTRNLYYRITRHLPSPDPMTRNAEQIDGQIISPHFQVEPKYKILQPRESYKTRTFLDLKDSDRKTDDVLYIQTGYYNFQKVSFSGIPVLIGNERSNELKLNFSQCVQKIKK